MNEKTFETQGSMSSVLVLLQINKLFLVDYWGYSTIFTHLKQGCSKI